MHPECLHESAVLIAHAAPASRPAEGLFDGPCSFLDAGVPGPIVVEMVRTCASAWISPSRHSNDRGSLWAAGPGRMTTLQAS